MALEDYVESEVAVAVAATAAVLSPRVRGLARRGAVYGLAGAITVGETASGIARGAGRGVRSAAESARGDGSGGGSGE